MNKTENTPENKAAFFAQYWGQEVLYPGGLPLEVISNIDGMCGGFKLSLKPLSQITENELKKIGFSFPYGMEGITIKFTPNSYEYHWKGYGNGYGEGYLKVGDFDFLRSKGYLLPWRDLSIEEILERGWAKYENQ